MTGLDASLLEIHGRSVSVFKIPAPCGESSAKEIIAKLWNDVWNFQCSILAVNLASKMAKLSFSEFKTNNCVQWNRENCIQCVDRHGVRYYLTFSSTSRSNTNRLLICFF